MIRRKLSLHVAKKNIKIFETLSDDAKEIRQAVFMGEQGFENEFDEIDERSTHIVMYNQENEPIATCRVFIGEDEDTYILGRLAVKKQYRGQNIGTKMVAEAEKVVKRKGGNSLCLHAQCRVKSFYEKSGFDAYGQVDEDEGCPHIWMKKQICACFFDRID